MQEGITAPANNNPSVYHDIREVLWKNAYAVSFTKADEAFKRTPIAVNPELLKLRSRFITLFNSTHARDSFCKRSQPLVRKVNLRLEVLGYGGLSDLITSELATSAKFVQQGTELLETVGIYQYPEQSFITDGDIRLAQRPMQVFAKNTDYLQTLGSLFNPDFSSEPTVRNGFYEGFNVPKRYLNKVRKLKRAGWDTVDILTTFLAEQQSEMRAVSIQDYEYNPDLSTSQNSTRLLQAQKEAFFWIGRSFSAISSMSGAENISFDAQPGKVDPVELFLYTSGKRFNDAQIAAVQKVGLAHVTHGLNSGELTARLGGSVRTTYPRAIIASFNIRSGIVHAGAVSECMAQTGDFLTSGKPADEFINELLTGGGKIYGFGHRIHKIAAEDSTTLLGKDPRVAFYIQSAVLGFPEKLDTIQKLVKFAAAVREINPRIGANTDFGAAVLFHCLDLPPQVASGFFTAFRTPGVCANIYNELRFKSNSRRPPFAPVIPY